MKSSRKLLAYIAFAVSVVGLFLAYSGLIIGFYGFGEGSDPELLGRAFESANVGVALIALGAALILLNLHRLTQRMAAAVEAMPANYVPHKIGRDVLVHVMEREKGQLSEKARPQLMEPKTVGLVYKEELESSADHDAESSLARPDASLDSEDQVQSQGSSPDEVVALTQDEVLWNDPDPEVLSLVPNAGPLTGRKAESERLQIMFEGRGTHLAVLIGSDGIGKTALVAQAAHEWVEDPSLVFWHRFKEDVHAGFDTLFLRLRSFFESHGDQSLSGVLERRDATTADKINAIIIALTKQNYSLIFDDLELLLDRRFQIQHPELQRLFAQFLQGGYPGLIVLVSKFDPVIGGQFLAAEAKIHLEGLDREASHELLRGLGYPGASSESLDRAYKLTRGNPHALLLLSSLTDNQTQDLLDDAGSREEESQDQLLELVVQELEEAELRLLQVAITHREPITEEVFRQHVGLESGVALETLQQLVRRHLLSYCGEDKTYRIHSLMRGYLVDRFEEEAKVRAHTEAAHYYGALPAPQEPESYDQVLDQVKASYHYFKAGQPAKANPLRLSKYFLRWGLDDLHLAMWLRIRDQLTGEDLSTCYNQIGLIYRAQRNYDEALDCFLETERIGKEAQDHFCLGPTYNNIGEIYRVRQEYDKALHYYLKSEKIREELGDQAGLGTIYNNIGLIKYSQGDYAEAQRYFERSYAILSQLSAHPEAEQVKENLELLVAQQSA